MVRLALRIVGMGVLVFAGICAAAYLYLVATAPSARGAKVFLQLGHGAPVRSVAFAPDGKTLASGSVDGTIKLWSVASGEVLRTLAGHESGVSSVAFTPDSQTLASGSVDRTIKLWSVASGEVLRTLAGHERAVNSVAFAPDGKTLASGSDDRTIKLWSVASGEVLRTLVGHEIDVSSVAFAADGKTLASGSVDQTIKLWSVASGEVLRTLAGHERAVNCVAFAPDGKTLASGSDDRTIKLWSVASGEGKGTLVGHEIDVSSVAFAPDGKTLASGGFDGTIRLLSVASGEVLRTLVGNERYNTSVAFAPDGTTLASGSGDGTIKLWSMASGELLRTLAGNERYNTPTAFALDGKTLASGSFDGIKLWSVASDEGPRTLAGHGSIVTSVAFAPDGQTLASGGFDGTIRLWSVASGEVLRTLAGNERYNTPVAFAPDGQTLASAGGDGTIKLWSVASGEVLRTLAGHGLAVSSVAFAPDGQTLASGSYDGTIKLWSVASGEVLRTLAGHGSIVTCVAFAPDGQTLASGSDDRTIKLWSVASGEVLRTLAGHESYLTCVAFAPDGQTLASGSNDRTIKLWSVASGEPLRTLGGHETRVQSVAFSGGAGTLAAASSDGVARWWSVADGINTLVAVASAGAQFLLLNPQTQRYASNRTAEEIQPAAIRFGDLTQAAYRLDYYRTELQVQHPRALLDLAVAAAAPTPKPVRRAWEQFDDKSWWLTLGLLGCLAVVAVPVLALRRSDPLVVANRYFAAVLGIRPRPLKGHVLSLGEGQVAMLFEGQQGVVQSHLQAAAGTKLYLIYREAVPSADDLAQLRKLTSAQLVPIPVHAMERAVAENAVTVDSLRRLEEPFVARADPYDEQRAVEAEILFFGRHDALARIPVALLQGQHVLVSGLRKVGKTSLLNQLRSRLAAHPLIHIDCQGYAPVALDLFEIILDKLRGELSRLGVRGLPQLGKPANGNDFRKSFLHLHQAWAETTSGARVILSFDELDKYFPERTDAANQPVLREYVALFRMLRALAQEHRCLALLAVAYRTDLNRQNVLAEALGENPMFMSYQEYFLGFLTADETARMIRELGLLRSIEWQEQAIARVHVLSGGHPLLARLVASDACQQGMLKQVKAAAVEAVANDITHSFRRHRYGSYLQESIWSVLRPEEQQLLQAVNAGRLVLDELDVNATQALASLQHFGLISDGASIEVQGELLSAWLQRNEG